MIVFEELLIELILECFLMHIMFAILQVQDKPEYNSGDLIVETVSKDHYTKTIISAVGISTISIILASVWWKYPGVLNSLQPAIFIRFPFLR